MNVGNLFFRFISLIVIIILQKVIIITSGKIDIEMLLHFYFFAQSI